MENTTSSGIYLPGVRRPVSVDDVLVYELETAHAAVNKTRELIEAKREEILSRKLVIGELESNIDAWQEIIGELEELIASRHT